MGAHRPRGSPHCSIRLHLTRIDTCGGLTGCFNTTFYTLRITDGATVAAKIRALNASGMVRAQPNYLFTLVQASADNASATPAPVADAPDPSQYALTKLHLDDAHTLALGDNVLVAVIDSGIDTTHPALAGVVFKSFDALGSSEGPHTHGTAIAGIIVGHGRLSGAAPSVHILAARAFGTTQGSTTSIIASLDWAVGEHAQVVNMSFAGPPDPAFDRSLAAAHQEGAPCRAPRRDRQCGPEVTAAVAGSRSACHRRDGDRFRRSPLRHGQPRPAGRDRGARRRHPGRASE